jgi:hypothetical protein
MDVLSGISVETFKILIVAVAVLVGGGVVFGFFRKWQWALFGAVFTYAVAAAGVGIYILLHINDPRWSAGKEPLLKAPSITDAPLIGQYLEPLNGFLNDTAISVNELVAFRHALPLAQEFFGLAGWALLALLPLAAIGFFVSRMQTARQSLHQQQELRRLQRGLDDVRARLGMDPLK